MKLSVQELHVRLAKRAVLRGVSFTVDPGEMVAVVGPNGSGKSTLVRSIAGVLTPASGTVNLNGSSLHNIPPKKRAMHLGLITQSGGAPELTTVREHVGLGRHAHRAIFRRWGSEDACAVEWAIATCQIQHLGERRMEALSGGERQRVRLATLLVQDPRILLLDEPLSGLDIEHQLALLHVLQDLNRQQSRTVICVLHDLDLALKYFKRVIVINEGAIAADGTPSQVLCPRIFESVFRVNGRIGCEQGGEPVIMCRQCEPSDPKPVEPVVRPTHPNTPSDSPRLETPSRVSPRENF